MGVGGLMLLDRAAVMRLRYTYTPKPLLPIYPLCIPFSFIDFLQKLLRYRSPPSNIVRTLCITSAPLRAFAKHLRSPSPFVAHIAAFRDVVGTTRLSHRSTIILHNHLRSNVGIIYMSLCRLAITKFEHQHICMELLLRQNVRPGLRQHADWLEQNGARIPFRDRSESGP
jgi:hypothetical protein